MPILPDKGAVHISTPLTNVSIAFDQALTAFVADDVWPSVPVDKPFDSYYTFDRTYFMRENMKERAPGTESQGTGFNVSNDPYQVKVFAEHFNVHDQIDATADRQINMYRSAAKLLTQHARIKREKTWAAKALVGASWTLTRTGVATVPANAGEFRQWDHASSDPVADIIRMKSEIAIDNYTGQYANGLVIGQRVFDKLLTNPAIIDRMKYGQTAPGPVKVTKEILRQMFDLEYLLVSSAVQVTSNEGAAAVVAAPIVDKSGLLFYRPPSAGLEVPSAGYTFSWTGYPGGGGGMHHVISQFRMQHLKADRVEIEMAYDQKVTSKDLGTFLTAIIA